MRIVILFMCLALASAEVEEFFKMWQTAMERLASHDVNTIDFQQTTQRPPDATTETVASNRKRVLLSRTPYTHPPWASYQENVAFVYARTQRHAPSLHHRSPGTHGPHQQIHGNHQYASDDLPHQLPGLHQQNLGLHQQDHEQHQQNHGQRQQDHGLHQQNHGQHQQDMGLHQRKPSLHQNYPTPTYDSPSPAVSRTNPTVQTQYGNPVKRPQNELTRAEQFVSDIERQLGFTMKGGNTLPHQNQYTRSAAPTGTPQGPRLNTQPVTWYQQNLFVAYPSPSYNSLSQQSFRHSQYPSMFTPPPYQSPSIQPWNRPYMKEEELEHYGNRYGWGPTNYYQPQTVHVYNQGYQPQKYVPMQQMNQNYGRVAPALQPTYTTSNIPVNTQRSSVYPSSPTYASIYTQARRSSQQTSATKPVIPTFETAFTRSSIPVPQSAGITAYMGQNQKRQQTMVRSNNAYSMNTPSWNTQSMNQRRDQTQINSQNRWTMPPYTQEAVQFNAQPFPKQTPGALNNQRPALPEEIAKMTTKPISQQIPARTPTMDQLAYYRPQFLHRTILSG